jgi:hypothetical protein
VREIIDPVFAKTSPKRSFSMTEYERFGIVFTKTRVYKFGHRWTSPCGILYLACSIEPCGSQESMVPASMSRGRSSDSLLRKAGRRIFFVSNAVRSRNNLRNVHMEIFLYTLKDHRKTGYEGFVAVNKRLESSLNPKNIT